ncbi:MAG: hypothetical protein M3R01_14585 [Actinomycetota bacterium]|nr:hypothetical protein [Actinomycetota bacterium]
MFPTKSTPGTTSTTEAAPPAKQAVKTLAPVAGEAAPGPTSTETTGTTEAETEVAGEVQERPDATEPGSLLASDSSVSGGTESSSFLPDSTLGTMAMVAAIAFLVAGIYCGWLLSFARR